MRFSPNKLLGQNFLKCEWVITSLLESGRVSDSDTVLEIGPGAGVLTRALAKKAKRVIAVEKDEHLASLLKDALSEEGIGNTEIIAGDVLSWLRHADSREYTKSPYKVIANIPYYLTSRLLRLLLEGERRPELIVLTIQREVAERIIAPPPQSSILSLSVHAFGKAEIIAYVPRSCFYPEPDVDSAIIRISDISDAFFKENALGQTLFFRAIRAAFSQKRKLLVNGLDALYPKENVRKTLEDLNLSLKTRPQELSLQEWANIVKKLG